MEFQLRRKWESALDELATLDFDGVRVEFEEALAGLERIVRETMFAPESRDAPVQVMGPSGGCGGEVRCGVVFAGGGFVLAGGRGGSPLLPWSLQRELGMPGADAAVMGAGSAGDGEDCGVVRGRWCSAIAREASKAEGETAGFGCACWARAGGGGVAELVRRRIERGVVG